MKTTTTLAILLGVLITGTEAQAQNNIKFCFKYENSYVDNGDAGEDTWATDAVHHARGARIIVSDQGLNELFDGYLGDAIGAGDPGTGCTSTMSVASVPQTYYYLIYSYGSVNGNTVRAYDSGGSTQSIFSSTTLPGGSGPGTYEVEVDVSTDEAEFDTYAAAAVAMQIHGGGLSGESFDFWVTNANVGYSDNTQIEVGSGDRKFVTIHEMGHGMSDLGTAGAFIGSNYSIYDVTCPSEGAGADSGTANLHSMRSKEYADAAVNEGFAHFYAAVTWNDDSAQDADCDFEYYKTTVGDNTPAVNCDTSNTNFNLAYHENVCGATAGRGVELDWLRAFWNVRTMGASNRPTFTAIVDWMDAATAPSDTNDYSVLDTSANGVGGQLNTNWDSTKVTNGVDH